MAKSNISYLIDEVNKLDNNESLLEWISAIENDISEMEGEIQDLKDEKKSVEKERDEFSEQVTELENEIKDFGSTLKTGIEDIDFQTPSHILVSELMDTLDDKLASNGLQKVIDVLNTI